MSDDQRNLSAPPLREARYSHFEAVLDCGECGEEIRVEGDVSNGETVRCDYCGADCEVYNR